VYIENLEQNEACKYHPSDYCQYVCDSQNLYPLSRGWKLIHNTTNSKQEEFWKKS